MALKSHELKQRMKKIEFEQKSILDEAVGALNTEQEQKFDSLQSEFENLEKQVSKVEQIEKREVIENENTREVEKLWKPGDLKPEEKKKAENLAMMSYLKHGSVPEELRTFMPKAKAESDDSSMINKQLAELGIRAAQQSTTDGSGGYTVPTGFQAELEIALKAYGGMFEAARIWNTSTGNVIEWPKVNDTANKAYLLAEAGNAETSAVKVTDAQQQFEAYKYTSGLIRVSSELLTDSAFNMPAVINELLAERIFRGLNQAFTTADGSSKPKGVVVAASHGNNTLADGAVSIDDFIALEHEVDPAYRTRPGTRYMFHDTVLAAVKKLKDQQNMPIWQPSFRDGAPALLNGYRYSINQDMASFVGLGTAADDNKKIALFGDFQKYIIRVVQGMRIVRLNERFGDTDEVGFVVFFRADGDLLDAGTHPVKYMRVTTT